MPRKKAKDVQPSGLIPTSPTVQPLHDKVRGITVLTESAAMHADEVAEKTPVPDYVERNPDRIFKIKPNEPAK